MAQEQGHFAIDFYRRLGLQISAQPTGSTCPDRSGFRYAQLADAMKLPFKPESVDELVANNPYGFGFKFLDDGVKFLEEVESVLKPGGCLVIRANWQNPFANENRMRQAVLQVGLTITVREINAQTEFPCHIFLTTQGRETIPNLEFVISKEVKYK